MSKEYQKPFTEAGRLNAELVTRKAYCERYHGQRCDCPICQEARKELKQRVNKLMGRKFYEDV